MFAVYRRFVTPTKGVSMEISVNPNLNVVVTTSASIVVRYVCWFVLLPRAYISFTQNETFFRAALCDAFVGLGSVCLYVGVQSVVQYYKRRPFRFYCM